MIKSDYLRMCEAVTLACDHEAHEHEVIQAMLKRLGPLIRELHRRKLSDSHEKPMPSQQATSGCWFPPSLLSRAPLSYKVIRFMPRGRPRELPKITARSSGNCSPQL